MRGKCDSVREMKTRVSMVKLIVVLFPLGLLVMAGGSLLIYEKRRVDLQPENPISKTLTEKDLLLSYKKLKEFMTPRGFGEKDLIHVVRTGAYIEGGLGYLNTGMNVKTENVLKQAGRVWKQYRLDFKGQGEAKQTYAVNYIKGGNLDLACILLWAQALPNRTCFNEVTVLLDPSTEETFLSEEVYQEARMRGQSNSLCYDGIDWEFLVEHLRAKLDQISFEKNEEEGVR